MIFQLIAGQDLTQISALVNEHLQENDGIYVYVFAIIEQELFLSFRINHNKVLIDDLRNL